MKEQREWKREKEVLAAEQKLEQKHLAERLKKRRQHQRKKEAKQNSPSNSNNGDVAMQLIDATMESPLKSLLLWNVAEMTQPKHYIVKTLPKDMKGRGAKCKHEPDLRVHVHWKHPVVFAMILEAQRVIPLPTLRWSPTEITRVCQAKSWAIFGGLTSQVVGRMIEHDETGQLRWKLEVLEEVAWNGHMPAPHLTRRPMLDECPEACKMIVQQLKCICDSGSLVTVTAVQAVIKAFLNIHAPNVSEKLKGSNTWVQKFVFCNPALC